MVAAMAIDMDPFLRWSLAIIAGGGLAAAVQTGTVAARGLSFSLSGGLSNPVVSTGELGGAVATSAMAVPAAARADMPGGVYTPEHTASRDVTRDVPPNEPPVH